MTTIKTSMEMDLHLFANKGPVTPLSNTSEEFLHLKDYLMDTRGSTHNANYQVEQIFRIERYGEFERFDAAHKTPGDRRLLWHGSRCTNFGGILSQGLRIAPPEAPVSGYGTCWNVSQDIHKISFASVLFKANCSTVRAVLDISDG